ncbi:MAG: TetR/AcrR family transcriptional regulator [Acidimicrobiales bacterium]
MKGAVSLADLRKSNSVGAQPSPPQPPTLRGARTRQAILNSARMVFERDGFLEARISDITTSASVAQGSFYRYFNSKEEVFRELFHDVVRELYLAAAATGESHGQLPIDFIERSNRMYFTVYAKHARLIRTIEQVATINEELGQLRTDVQQMFTNRIAVAIDYWQQAGLVSSEVDSQIAALALGSMTDRLAYTWLAQGTVTFDFEEAIKTINFLWLHALGRC